MNYQIELKKFISSISGCSAEIQENQEIIIQPTIKLSGNHFGFAEWNILESGWGDYVGFYWPIGKELNNPIIVESRHDNWELIPWSSNIERFLKILLASKYNEDSDNLFYFDKEEFLDNLREHFDEAQIKMLSKKINPRQKKYIRGIEDVFLMDQDSPYCLKLKGDAALKENKLDEAKTYYKNALTILPEYGACSFMLGKIARREKDISLAIGYFIETLCAPFYFCKDHKEALNFLARIKDDSLFDPSDPIWKRRHVLKFDDGEKYPTFHNHFNEIIEEYILSGEFNKALGLRLFLGRFAWSDDSLKTRYTIAMHSELLLKDLKNTKMEIRSSLYYCLQNKTSVQIDSQDLSKNLCEPELNEQKTDDKTTFFKKYRKVILWILFLSLVHGVLKTAYKFGFL